MKLSARKAYACIYAEPHIQHDGSFDTEDLNICKLLEGRIAMMFNDGLTGRCCKIFERGPGNAS